jgi:hypothetical protein
MLLMEVRNIQSQRCIFPLKTATLEAGKVSALCREESMSDLSSLAPHGINTPF